jgi:hypothetical protein
VLGRRGLQAAAESRTGGHIETGRRESAGRDLSIAIHENTDREVNIAIPAKPVVLSDKDLDATSACQANACSFCGSPFGYCIFSTARFNRIEEHSAYSGTACSGRPLPGESLLIKAKAF